MYGRFETILSEELSLLGLEKLQPQRKLCLQKYGVPKAKKLKFYLISHFFIHIQWKLYVKDKFCTLLNYTLLNVNNYCTLLKVNYMLYVKLYVYHRIIVLCQLI